MIGFYSYTVILTYLSLVFAMVGIHLSVIGVYQWSFICLMMCGICDTFDGMVARSKKNRTEEEKKQYIQYIDEVYNAERLTNILTEVSHIIGANILNIAKQDYDPQGASVTILISEEEIEKEDVVMHLDKSHLTVHTYPESHPHKGISTFRADIEVSTCGQISPLKALNYLINSFDSDILTLDYHVRGFTRDVSGKKIYIDHRINSIQNYINAKTRNLYNMIDVNVYQENIFHTKMMLKDFDLDNYLFGITEAELSEREIKQIKHQLRQEMTEIFYGRNLPSVKA